MKREEAEQVFGMIAAVYGLHPERSGEQAVVWVPALEELPAEAVMTIVSAWMRGNGPDRLPTLVAFVGEVRRLIERQQRDAQPALPTKEGPGMPLWYIVWQKLRADGRDEILPEMERGYRLLGYEWPPPDREILGEEERMKLLEWAAGLEQTTPRILIPAPECELCEDTGYVALGHYEYRLGDRMARGTEQVGPCPKCERGKRIEFPLESVGPWGTEGFWRGRHWTSPTSGVVEMTP